MNGCRQQGLPLAMELPRKFNNQNGVFCRQADKRNQADLEENVIRHAGNGHRDHRANKTQRNDQHDRKME